MSIESDLIDLAEKCFQQADRQENPLAAEALREMALSHLEEAHAAWSCHRGLGLPPRQRG
jgi:hypothetical protein